MSPARREVPLLFLASLRALSEWSRPEQMSRPPVGNIYLVNDVEKVD